MKRVMKLITVIAIITMILSLVACGSNTEQKSTNDQASSSVTPIGQSQTSTIPDTSSNTESGAKDLIASLANIPGLADSPDKGAFVDLVKALDDVYPGKIKIEVAPFARSIENVVTGKADFHIPTLRNDVVDQAKLPFKLVTKKMGTVVFIIYSNVDNKITSKMLSDAVAKGGTFPYKIECAGGIEANFPFPVTASNDLEQSLKKVESKRIDAVAWSQDEGDTIIRNLKLKSIYREHWGDFDDVMIVAKNANGDEMDKLLSDCLQKMEDSGKLKELMAKIHKPYEDWQPATMGW